MPPPEGINEAYLRWYCAGAQGGCQDRRSVPCKGEDHDRKEGALTENIHDTIVHERRMKWILYSVNLFPFCCRSVGSSSSLPLSLSLSLC